MNSTHEVFNQPAALSDYNLFDTNRPLRDALKFNAPALDTAQLSQLGVALGSSAMQTHARLANVHGPVLHSHDRFGRRVDQVEFHPSYHALMRLATGAGLHGTPWGSPHPNPLPGGEGTRGEAASADLAQPENGTNSSNSLPLPLGEGRGEGSPHVARAAGFMLFTELEPSTLCPISMTYAATPALRGNTAIYADWGPKLVSRSYDPELKPWQAKAG
ncbi:MAG: DNA alkylation response protein, partial [Polaromonas sp.]|nr:DNA alkylation response protein [Polaromonas sp.]